MGILPSKTATGVEKNYTIDGATQTAELLNTANHDGSQVGGALAKLSSTAESSNSLSVELDQRMKSLEQKVSAIESRVAALEQRNPNSG